tara:strand:+ start:129 stop:353 length:225 start_codon:yes stop_codon:yes gene_type:complete
MPNKEIKPIKINKNIEGHLIIRLPIFLISCSLFNLDDMIPKLKHRINIDIVDVKKWNTAALYEVKPIKINKIPN